MKKTKPSYLFQVEKRNTTPIEVMTKKDKEDYLKQKEEYERHYLQNTKHKLNPDTKVNKKGMTVAETFDLVSGGLPQLTNMNKDFFKYDQDDSRQIDYDYQTLVIDSRDRDISLYPSQNRYSIENLGYTNVVEVDIISSIFPNTQIIVTATAGLANNKIYWQNQTDIDPNTLETYTYVVNIPTGNYTATQLEAVIIEQMNSVQRIGANSPFHDVEVSINQTTDTTTFISYESFTVSNPFTITELPGPGEFYTDIEVYYPGWESTFSIGDIITISGSTDIDGISSTFINTDQTIREKIDDDTFTFRVNVNATSLVTNQGGDSVVIRKRLNWKLLWSFDDSMYEVLGFQNEDTSFNTIHVNTEETFNFFDSLGNGQRIKINYIDQSTISSNFSTVYTVSEHGLSQGDIVYFNYIETDGLVYDHFKDEVVLSEPDEERLALFLTQLYNAEGLTVGTITSPTSFTVPVPYESIAAIESYIISNVDDTDENGDIILRTINTSIKLTTEQYFYITSPQLGGSSEFTKGFETNQIQKKVSDIFAVVNLAGSSGSTIFNSYVFKPKTFRTPININKLEFSFRLQNGNLIDFLERDHTFILRFKTLRNRNKNQDYSSRSNIYT